MIATFDGAGSHALACELVSIIIGDSRKDSLIDLCCNLAPITGPLPFAKKRFVDIAQKTIRQQECFVLADALGQHPVFAQRYDVATCLDGIEHLTRTQGFLLIARMKALADKAIIFTPLHPWCIEPTGSDRYLHDPTSHKSLWGPADFPGWASIVMPKFHPTLGIGAFFAWTCPDVKGDFRRVQGRLTETISAAIMTP